MVDPVALRTERLRLRPWTASDVDSALDYIDEAFVRYLAIPWPYGREDAGRFVALRLEANWDEHPAFAIELDGRVIGDTNIRIATDHGRGECGWGIGSEYWGQGYTTEAARAVISWALATFDLGKVEATADGENTGSWRVMEKLGMTREGYLRSHRVLRGQRRDVVWYGIMRDEFLQA